MQATPILPLASASIALPRRQSAPMETSNPEAISLHVGAENALAMALNLLRDPACTAADLERATARACRAADLLRRACAAHAGRAAA